jgi:hypothetical protein
MCVGPHGDVCVMCVCVWWRWNWMMPLVPLMAPKWNPFVDSVCISLMYVDISITQHCFEVGLTKIML